MKKYALLFPFTLTVLCGWSAAKVEGSTSSVRNLPPDISEHVISTHVYNAQNQDSNTWGNKQIKEVTITKNVPVPVPVKVERHVAVPVKIPFPVAVQSKVPVVVERKIPIYVDRPIPVQVDRPVPYPLPVEVPVFHKVAFEVPKPFPVHVPRPYPVYIEKAVYGHKSPPGKRVKKSPILSIKTTKSYRRSERVRHRGPVV